MSWKRLRGHDSLIRAFQLAWKKGRLGHAYLCVGPAGVGKFTFAHEAAKALLCERSTEKWEACDQCASCSLIDADTHPDLHTTSRPEDKQEFPIDNIRTICEELALKPARGVRKVAIISDVDDFTTDAANAFLKTLEEPPPGTTLFLIGGNSSERQLPTILSRCQILRFAPLFPALLRELLQENDVTDPVRVERLVRLAEGSIGQALALEDDALWEFREFLIEMITTSPVDTVVFTDRWNQFVEEAGKEAALRRRRASLCIRLLMGLLEEALRITQGYTGQDFTDPDAASDEPKEPSREAEALEKLAQRLGPKKLMQWIDRCLDADQQNERKVQLEVILEALVDFLGRS